MPASTSTAPHVPGLSAWLRRASGHDHADGISSAQASAISAWADIDSDLGHLAVPCECGCEAVVMPAGIAAEACSDIGSHTTPPRLSLLRRMHISLVERRLDIVRDERDRYSHAGVIGPIYHRNSLVAQINLMKRIRELRGLQ